MTKQKKQYSGKGRRTRKESLKGGKQKEEGQERNQDRGKGIRTRNESGKGKGKGIRTRTESGQREKEQRQERGNSQAKDGNASEDRESMHMVQYRTPTVLPTLSPNLMNVFTPTLNTSCLYISGQSGSNKKTSSKNGRLIFTGNKKFGSRYILKLV